MEVRCTGPERHVDCHVGDGACGHGNRDEAVPVKRERLAGGGGRHGEHPAPPCLLEAVPKRSRLLGVGPCPTQIEIDVPVIIRLDLGPPGSHARLTGIGQHWTVEHHLTIVFDFQPRKHPPLQSLQSSCRCS